MKYGLIGEKLGHSFSKPIHEKIADYTYETKEIAKEDLEKFIKLRRFSGINITIPYKSVVIPYLDSLDPIAKNIGAVNTVVNRDGKLHGYNTDFGGMKMLIEKSGFDYKGKKVIITGTGGTSKTAKAVATALGAAEIITVGRPGSKDYEGVNYDNVYELHSDADYIINTTPVGMFPDCDSVPVDVSAFTNLKGVTDAVYNPMKTRLCREAEANGISSASGLYMLVCQAVLACEIFLDKELDTKLLADRIYEDIIKEKENIILIGMPGSGKTTVGKMLAKALNKKFVDIDKVITDEHGVISDIFREKGEDYFREIESLAVKNVASLTGCVISTGGGVILKNENIISLRQNGRIVFLDRPVENIVPTDDRPLSSNIEALKKLFSERYEKYLQAADYRITVNGNVEQTVLQIMEKIK